MSADFTLVAGHLREEFPTVQQVVTDRLRAAILDGRLAPGSRLQQDALADQFGVSRMPVREALRVLQSEGLVELRPHRGAVVVSLRVQDIDEIFEIRAMLEARAAELAAPRLTDAAIARLRWLHDDMARLTGDEEGWIGRNHDFHTSIYIAAGWPRLIALIEAQRNAVRPYLRTAFAVLARTPTAHDEHRRILEAAAARDPARLAALTAEHLRTTKRGLMAHYAAQRVRSPGGDPPSAGETLAAVGGPSAPAEHVAGP